MELIYTNQPLFSGLIVHKHTHSIWVNYKTLEDQKGKIFSLKAKEKPERETKTSRIIPKVS